MTITYKWHAHVHKQNKQQKTQQNTVVGVAGRILYVLLCTIRAQIGLDEPIWAPIGPIWIPLSPNWAQLCPNNPMLDPFGPKWAQFGLAWIHLGPNWIQLGTGGSTNVHICLSIYI